MTVLRNLSILVLSLGAASAAGACASDEMAEGTLEIAVYGEDYIEVEIPAADVVDGWTIVFDGYDVTISAVQAAAGDSAPAFESQAPETLDLTAASNGSGHVLATADVSGGAYDRIAYRIDRMEVSGTATKGTVTKTFAWTFDTPTLYTDCEGTAVVDGDVARTLLTVHADHLFYDDLVSSEPNVAFDLIAQADDDGDADGEITREELEALDITGENRYQVGNATDVEDLWAFIDQQSSTVGHIDGEGHCGNFERVEN